MSVEEGGQQLGELGISKEGGPATLKIGTHNLRGMRTNLQQALKIWKNNGLGIVLIQEIKMNQQQLHQLEATLEAWGWRGVWSPGTNRSLGVGILISVKVARFLEFKPIPTPPSTEGRLVAIHLKWKGHSFQLMSIHMPNIPKEQEYYFNRGILPMIAQAPTIMGGDFNFVENPCKDRLRKTALATDKKMMRLWEPVQLSMVDLYRSLHPNRTGITHVQHRSGARLDRFYAHTQLAGHIPYAGISGHTPSDHALTHITICGRINDQNRTPRQGARPINLDFLKDASCGQLFEYRLRSLIATLPLDDTSFIAYWPTFKNKVGQAAKWCQGKYAKSQQLLLKQAGAQLNQAMSSIEEGDTSQLHAVLEKRRQFKQVLQETVLQESQSNMLKQVANKEQPSKQMTAILSSYSIFRKMVPEAQQICGLCLTSQV